MGFDTRDDAGVFRLTDDLALVQTVDFFTPIVDDPYAYGQIVAANSLSDVYAMGGRPLTVLNIACFNPLGAPADTWAKVLLGMHDKTAEAGALILGGHSIEDKEPKFGMAVTGVVDPARMFANTGAEPGDAIYLTKPLGTGILTLAAHHEKCTPEELQAGIESMTTLNKDAAERAIEAEVRCATDVPGFGLTGHLYNVARASEVAIRIDSDALPLLPGLKRMLGEDISMGGAVKNRRYLGEDLRFEDSVPEWIRQVVLDPQTSGGLALFSKQKLPYPRIGEVSKGEPTLTVR